MSFEYSSRVDKDAWSVSEIKEDSWKPTDLPFLRQHTKEVLLELGHSGEEIEQLAAMKVIKI